jgi:hypothetical protein
MGIPGLSTLKTWGMVAVGFALTVVYALLQVEKAGRAKDKLAIAVNNRKIQAEAIKEINKGLNREIKTQESIISPDHFS